MIFTMFGEIFLIEIDQIKVTLYNFILNLVFLFSNDEDKISSGLFIINFKLIFWSLLLLIFILDVLLKFFSGFSNGLYLSFSFYPAYLYYIFYYTMNYNIILYTTICCTMNFKVILNFLQVFLTLLLLFLLL